MDEQPCKYVVSVAMTYKNRVYMSRRQMTVIHPEKWQFACADIDGDNFTHNAESAASILEEMTGLQINTKRIQYLGPVFEDSQVDICYMYYVKLFDGEIPQRTEPELMSPWYLFPFSLAEKFDIIPGMAKVIRYLKFLEIE